MSYTISSNPQGSSAWLAERVGLFTASCAGDMLSTIKSGEAAGRRNLRVRLALERLIGRSLEDVKVSAAMAAGTEREPLARAAIEAAHGYLIEEVGFLRSTVHPWAGCSLDGHVDDFRRLVEIKCRQPAAHWEFLRSGTIPADAMAQIRHELWLVPQADALDYCCWSPDFAPRLQLRVVTVTRAEADLPAYEAKALAFLAEVQLEYDAMRTLAEGVTT